MYKRISDGEERKLYTSLVARKNILASHLINHSNLHELQVLAGIDEALFRFWKPKDQDLESLNKPCGDPSRFCFSYTFEDYPSKPFSKRKANSRERKGLKATDANSLRAFDDFLNEQFPDCNFVNPSGLETRIDENDPPAMSA
jgi:hypothetical protein